MKTGNQDARTWKLTMREEKTVSEKNLMFYKGFSILDGKLFSGICVDYYDNGRKKYEIPFKNGQKEGLSTFWYVNGQKKSEGYHQDGIQEITTWYPFRYFGGLCGACSPTESFSPEPSPDS